MRMIALFKKTGGAVWCGGGLPSVRLLPYGEPEVVSWADAALLVGIELEGVDMQKRIREKIRKAKLVSKIEKKGMGIARNAEWVSDEEMDRRAIVMLEKKA